MNLNDQLAAIRDKAGLEPLPHPGMIQGFEPGSPPVPPYIPPPDPNGWIDEDPDAVSDAELDAAVAPPPSPLIPRRAPAPNPAPPVAPVVNPPLDFHLVVADKKAAWKNREVELTDTEEKAIRTIVLRAIQREVDSELQQVVARRRRRPAVTEVAGEQEVVKRGPGRPKKKS